MAAPEFFCGRVHSVRFDDPTKAFYILQMDLKDEGQQNTEMLGFEFGYSPEDSNLVTVKGYIPGLDVKVGTWFGFEATWTRHPKYGKQLKVTKAPVMKGVWDPSQAAEMLKANGVGGQVVDQIRRKYPGDKFIPALESVSKLAKVQGLAKFSAKYVVERWQYVTAYFRTLEFISQQGLPSGKVAKVWSHFGDDAVEVLSVNPWRLVEIEGIKFQHADNIARRLNLDMNGKERIRGAVLFACVNQKSMGHMYLTVGQVYGQVRLLCSEATLQDVAEALRDLHLKEYIIVDKTTREGTIAVYEPWSYMLEDESSRLLVERITTASIEREHEGLLKYTKALVDYGTLTEELWESANKVSAPLSLAELAAASVEDWSETAHLKLSQAQKQGVTNALVHPVSVLTGLPGTGKTTSLKAAVQILIDLGERVLLCAPTGIAAKRLSTVTDTDAYTIHRAFGAKGFSKGKDRESTYAGIIGDRQDKKGPKGEDEFWDYGPGNPHPASVVIIDESSMVDQHLMYRIMASTDIDCRLVLVGDAAQLPSVGPGNVLRDLIGSGSFPVVNLTEIFRQEDTSGIVFAAHAVFRGEIPELSTEGDFVLVPVSSDDKVAEIITKLAVGLYARERNFQILSPRHKGSVGVTALNATLRDLLNPKSMGTQEVRLGNETLREGDRVMIVKNDYNRGVFNGDVGKINRIMAKDKHLEIKIHGKPSKFCRIPFKEALSLLRMAYACTVHKAQGLEYDTIVIPVVDSFRHQLQRNLYYTAITRAKKKVIMVGTSSAFRSAVWNSKEDARNTLFKFRIRKLLENPEKPRTRLVPKKETKPTLEEIDESVGRVVEGLLG